MFAAGSARAQTTGWSFIDERQQQPQTQFYYNSNSYYNPNPVAHGTTKLEYAPAHRRRVHAKIVAVHQQPAEPEKPAPYEPPIAGIGPLGPFINDSTLRRGDIVVTSIGIQVFQGPSSEAHKAKEFIALAHAYFSNKRRFVELTQIEQTNHKYASRFEVADAGGTAGDGQASPSKPKNAFVVLETNRK